MTDQEKFCLAAITYEERVAEEEYAKARLSASKHVYVHTEGEAASLMSPNASPFPKVCISLSRSPARGDWFVRIARLGFLDSKPSCFSSFHKSRESACTEVLRIAEVYGLTVHGEIK